MLSFIPFLVLIVLITCCVAVFGNATLDGASQVSLLVASAVSVVVGHFSKRLEWENLEKDLQLYPRHYHPVIDWCHRRYVDGVGHRADDDLLWHADYKT